MKKRVVVAMSGGVDSSVAALLLKEKGYQVIGIFMKNWHQSAVTIKNTCPWTEDFNQALTVAQQLQIPFYTIDLSKEYREKVVDYMFNTYSQGKTPNPDILCNREIKFEVFYEKAKRLSADYIATGHYCRKISKNKHTHSLLMGVDKQKDQSYFLCQLHQNQLQHALFPIGELTKKQVRSLAKEAGLTTAERKDSQGLCFVGKIKLPVFLAQKLEHKKGKIVKIPFEHPIYEVEKSYSLHQLCQKRNYKECDGVVIGTHIGAHYFTIGQRKGLSTSGNPNPLFVIDIDINENILYVGEGKSHKGLFKRALFLQSSTIHWIRNDTSLKIGEVKEFHIKIRYRQEAEKATFFCEEEGIYVYFEKPQRALTSGQFIVWYKKEEMIGSTEINI